MTAVDERTVGPARPRTRAREEAGRPDAVPQPRTVVARLQPRASCSRPATSAIRCIERVKFLTIFAGMLDEFFQIRIAGPAPAGHTRVGLAVAGRPDRGRAARGRPIARPRARRGARRARTPRSALPCSREGHRDRRLRGDPGAPRDAPPAVPRRDLPGPDAARGRSGSPVPVHLDAQPVDRRGPARPRDGRDPVRPGEGAARSCRASSRSSRTTSSCSTRSSRRTSMSLFTGMEVVEHHLFRVTRNADLAIEEDEADDLLMAIEEELRRRRFGEAVRLEVERSMPAATRQILLRGHRPRRGRLLRDPGDARPDRPPGDRRARSRRTSGARHGRRSRRHASSRPTRTSRPTSSPPSGPATCSSTTRTRASTRRSSGSSPRPSRTPRSSRSR